MKLAVFGQPDKFEDAITGLKLSPTEVHLPSELPIIDLCQKRKFTTKTYAIDWKSIDVPGAVIGENKFGQYNKMAPRYRQDLMLDNVDAVLLLGEEKSNPYIEKDIGYRTRRGEKIELLKWPCQTKVTRPEPQPSSDLPPDEDIPF